MLQYERETLCTCDCGADIFFYQVQVDVSVLLTSTSTSLHNLGGSLRTSPSLSETVVLYLDLWQKAVGVFTTQC